MSNYQIVVQFWFSRMDIPIPWQQLILIEHNDKYCRLTAFIKFTICLKIGCPTDFISVFLSMLYYVSAKTKVQHGGEPLREHPPF
jgi:hypothetical protein